MRRKKVQPLDSRAALRQVRKAVPPPSRVKADETKYRRVAVRRAVREEIEQGAKEE